MVVPPPLRAITLAGMAQRLARPILAVVPGEREAEDLADDVELFTDRVSFLPAWEILPFEHVSPNVRTMAHRTEARHRLESDEPVVIVGSVRGVTQRLSPSSPLPVTADTGTEVDFERFVSTLVDVGYSRTDRVEARGEFAVRGGIVDVFPAQGYDPVRLDFWGDTVEEIRTFTVASQRSRDVVSRLVAYPARELLLDDAVRSQASRLGSLEPWAVATWDRIAEGIHFQGMESWLPWLAPAQSLLDVTQAAVVLFDPERARARSIDLIKEEADLAAALVDTWGSGAPDAGAHPALYLPLDVDTARGPPSSPLRLRPGPATRDMRLGASMPCRRCRVDCQGRCPMDPARRRHRGCDGRAVRGRSCGRAALRSRSRASGRGSARDGRILCPPCRHPSRVCVPCYRRRRGRRTRDRRSAPVPSSRSGQEGSETATLPRSPAGRFRRPSPSRHRAFRGARASGDRRRRTRLPAGRLSREDKLYVPTDQLAAMPRYTGGETPRLSRMGGTDWATTRSKVRKAVAVVAEEVVALHRGEPRPSDMPSLPTRRGRASSTQSFPYEETPDQLTAIADVKRDMEPPQPMDRLIFGDVGFGKTEVALRAMFKAVQSGKQTAMLVPTTLLAQQHFATFEERFGPFPVRVEMLSRFLTTAKQQRRSLPIWQLARSTSSSAPTACCPRTSVQGSRAAGHRRGAAVRRCRPRTS